MSEASVRTQWKKGQSGNPKGRPKKPKPLADQGQMVSSIARVLLDHPCYLLGHAEPVTRQTRLMLDVVERAELGDLRCTLFLLNEGRRGDRLKLQALRRAMRAKTKEEARFERRNAVRVSPPTPGLTPDQEHLIRPARELRTEHLKPVKKAAPKKREYEFDHWRQPDPLAGIPKHLTKEERDRRDALTLAAMAAIPPAPERAMDSPPQTQAETAPKSASGTPSGTGPKTGPITGLSNTLNPHQAVEVPRESESRIDGSKNFAIPATIDGAPMSITRRNGPPA